MSQNSIMREKSSLLWWVLGGLGLLFIISSLIITLVEYNRFRSQQALFPPGSLVADVPVGGLDKQEAITRVEAFYQLPLILDVQGGTIYADPQDLGFSIDVPSLVAEGLKNVKSKGFWAHLWGQPGSSPVAIPLDAAVDDQNIEAYLAEQIAPRYIQTGRPITPILGTTNFQPGQAGQGLDIPGAVEAIRQALLSPSIHQVRLDVTEDVIPPATEGMLAAFLKDNIHWVGFDQLAEVYLAQMGTNQVVHFAIEGGEDIQPDVAFTAASTIKIPIMVSVLRRTPDPTPEAMIDLLERMIVYSENPPADTLMSTYLDDVRGPLVVTEDMRALGLENTFLAGYFYLGAPLLERFETPANSRTDVYLDPDIYSQTVASEIGRLMWGIYDCALDGSGLLTETFPGEITQSECQLMIDILSANRIGLLIEAGLPPDTIAAHKHGWVQELDGLLHSVSDVAIVFTPGGDYVLNLAIYDPVRLDFEQGDRLIARLSQTVYNFFNIDNQAYWWFD
jgi:hypothetical protein